MESIISFFNSLSGWLLVLLYLLLAIAVIFATNKISNAVDNIDKLSNIGGAFIGGIFLAAVTSLPELITSISSVAVVKNPDLVFGNILGSNLFNMMVLCVVDLIFIKLTFLNKVKTMKKTNLFTMIMYVVILLPLVLSFILNACGLNINLFVINGIGVSVISIVILVVYFISVKALAGDSKVSQEDSEESLPKEKKPNDKKALTKEILIFSVWSLALVFLSITLTIVVDAMSAPGKLFAEGIGGGLAGALFLASATSLPEATAVISLVKLRNYDAAVGNIIGSNVFNFTIISIVDIIFFKTNVFEKVLSSQEVITMLVIGLISAGLVMYSLVRTKSKNKFTYALPSILVIISYFVFLIIQTL